MLLFIAGVAAVFAVSFVVLIVLVLRAPVLEDGVASSAPRWAESQASELEPRSFSRLLR